MEGTFEKEPCAAPDKVTVKLGYTYQWPAADLSLELTFQGTSATSNSGSICPNDRPDPKVKGRLAKESQGLS